MSPKKLLFYTKGLTPGSPEIALVSLLGQLSPQEYEVDLILYDNHRLPGAANLAESLPDWINVYDYAAEKDSGVLPQYNLLSVQNFPVLQESGPYRLADLEENAAEEKARELKRTRGKTRAKSRTRTAAEATAAEAEVTSGESAAQTSKRAAEKATAATQGAGKSKTRSARAKALRGTGAAETGTAVLPVREVAQTLEAVKGAKPAKSTNGTRTIKTAKGAKPVKTAQSVASLKDEGIAGAAVMKNPAQRSPRSAAKKGAAASMGRDTHDPAVQKADTAAEAEVKVRLEQQIKMGIDNFFKTFPLRKRPEMELPYSAYDYARTVVAGKEYDWAFSYGEWVSTSFVAQDVQAQSKAIWIHKDDYSRSELANLLAYEGYYQRVIFPSLKASERSATYVPLLADKAAVVRNFCDHKYVRRLAEEPVEDFRQDERPLIVTIADIHSEENCLKLLDVAQGLRESGAVFHWLCINNMTDKALNDKIRKKSAKLNLGGYISWISGVANPYKYLRGSDVLAFLSDQQSWCQAISEAKTLGVPIVATRTGDALQQITDSVDGILTDFSVEEICDALRTLLEDQGLQKRIRENLQGMEPDKAALDQFSKLVKRRAKRMAQSPRKNDKTETKGHQTVAVPEKAAGDTAKISAKLAAKTSELKNLIPSAVAVKNKPAKIKESPKMKASRVLHRDNRTLFVLDDVNYKGGSHSAVRNLMHELGELDISVFTAALPTLATLKEWGHVKFVFPPNELWESALMPDISHAPSRVFSLPLSWFSKARRSGGTRNRPLKHKQRQALLDYELRRKFSQYDTVCIIGEASPYREIVANCSCRTKIAWIHTDYAAWKHSGKEARLAARRDAYTYARYNYIIFSSHASRDGFVQMYPQLASKTRVIGNAMPVESIRAAARKSRRKLKIVTIARLDFPKGMDRLLDVAAQLVHQGYDFNWNVIGSGPEEEALKKKAAALNVQGFVNFLGEMANPYQVLAQGDLFALFSEYEGLPNTVYEALILGVPVMATRVGGLCEQVVEGRNGWLVGNSEEEILGGLRQIMDNPEELDRLKNKMPVYKYDNTSVIEQVQDLIL